MTSGTQCIKGNKALTEFAFALQVRSAENTLTYSAQCTLLAPAPEEKQLRPCLHYTGQVLGPLRKPIWYSVNTKYDTIKEIMLERYTDDSQESKDKREMISKERIVAQMKKIRKDYQESR